MLEQAALDEKAEQEAAEHKRIIQNRMQMEQSALLEERRQQKKLELEKELEERRLNEIRQEVEDQTIADARREILEQHAPLLIGFLPPGVFRNLEEIRSLPNEVQRQFQRHVRIEDDPELW